MIKNTDQLIRLIAEATPLTKKQYPALEYLPHKEAKDFIVGHSVSHLSVSSGYMQKAIEHAEHGEELDEVLLRKKTISAAFSVLKLCEVLNISGDELIREIENLAEHYIEANKK